MIDYLLLHDSICFYADYGFKRIESPWTVSKAVDDITKPDDKISFQLKHNNKCLVASGEQSFLYLYLKDFLPKGKFQTVTPCYRYEEFDTLHTKYFMKNELIITDDVSEDALRVLLVTAAAFFKQYFDEVKSVKTDIGYDLEINGHELGSYGIRQCEFLTWIYGTGCAEPRLSNLIKRYGISFKGNK